MRRNFLNAKIHRATVTDAQLHYVGSCGIDTELMERAGILPNETIQVVNVTNGERLVTYAIPAGPGEVVLNGAAARRGAVGDGVIIMSFADLDDDEFAGHQPRVVLVDGQTRPLPD